MIARALSSSRTGVAKKAIGDTGSYSIVKSTKQEFSAPFLSFIKNIIRQSFAMLRRPSGEKKASSQLAASDTSHFQRTCKGIIGGNPKTSSIVSPTPIGILIGCVSLFTERELATMLGQFEGVARKVCASAALTGSAVRVVSWMPSTSSNEKPSTRRRTDADRITDDKGRCKRGSSAWIVREARGKLANYVPLSTRAECRLCKIAKTVLALYARTIVRVVCVNSLLL